MGMGRIFSARNNRNFFSPARTRPGPKNAQVYLLQQQDLKENGSSVVRIPDLGQTSPDIENGSSI
jgi:hypothetical protein